MMVIPLVTAGAHKDGGSTEWKLCKGFGWCKVDGNLALGGEAKSISSGRKFGRVTSSTFVNPLPAFREHRTALIVERAPVIIDDLHKQYPARPVLGTMAHKTPGSG